MAWLAPPGFGSMTFRGETIAAGQDGRVDISGFDPTFTAALAAELPTHGFVVVDDFAGARDADVFPTMKRAELFAYIKAHGGSANIALRNDELCAIARALRPDA